MKEKIISKTELDKLKGNKIWEEIPLLKSPFNSLTFPPSTLCAYGSTNLSLSSCASISIAGISIFREDIKDDPYFINLDQYNVYFTQKKDVFNLVKLPKEEIPNHWLKKIPKDK